MTANYSFELKFKFDVVIFLGGNILTRKTNDIVAIAMLFISTRLATMLVLVRELHIDDVASTNSLQHFFFQNLFFGIVRRS